MTPEAHTLSPDQIVLTAVLYTAFAVYCATEAVVQYRARGRVSPRVIFVLCLSLVFAFCEAVGYLPEHPALSGEWIAWAHPLLNVFTMMLVGYSLWRRPLRDIGELETRVNEAEAASMEIAAALSESMRYGVDSIRQVMLVKPDPPRAGYAGGPLVGPDGTPHTLCIIAATPAMRRYFNVPEDGAVEGRPHYDVYPGIYDASTGEVGIPEWIDEHQRALGGETITCDRAEYTGPDGRTRVFRYAINPLQVGPDGFARSVLFDMRDLTPEADLQQQIADQRDDFAREKVVLEARADVIQLVKDGRAAQGETREGHE